MTTQEFKDEAYSEGTGQAYIVLVTFDHETLIDPMRFTNEGSIVISRGEVYSPLAMDVTVVDSVQGRSPEASLRLDNVNLEVTRALRELQGYPTVTIDIVRASDLDTPEKSYTDLRVIGPTYTAGFIDLQLGIEDLSVDFPSKTMDRSWPAAWPS